LSPWTTFGQTLPAQDALADAAEVELSGVAAQVWTLEADRVESLQNEQIFKASGNVLIRQGENVIQADMATYFRETGFAHLSGNVRINWNGDVMAGEFAEFNLQDSVGRVTDGGVFFSEEHYYIRGKLLEKTCEKTYRFKDAQITTCDGPVPAWSVKSSKGEITTGGYARLWHPRFQVKNTPILYFPYLIFPVKTERQSGFLIPEPFYSSRLGFGLNIPYYWVINEEQDVTFYANMMSKRGVMTGLEYRHFTSLDSKGVWRADWLHDKETAPTEADESPQFRDDGLIRSSAHRYWIRGKYDGFLGDPLWRIKVDLDLVSDQNYLREFKHGDAGFERTQDQMLADFGRGMRRIDSVIRKNAVELSRNWTMLGFRGSLQYDQHLAYWTDNRPSKDNPTLQRLPELNLNLYRITLSPTPLELESRNQAVYFWREKGSTGSRIEFLPKVSLPWSTGMGTLTPSVLWRQTFYVIDRHDDSWEGVDESKRFFEQGIPEFRVEAFSSLFRVFDLGVQDKLAPTLKNIGNRRWSKVKHTIQPELRYSYIPERDLSGNPQFVEEDKINKRNRLSYTLRNTFNRRLDTVVQHQSEFPTNEGSVSGYGEESGLLAQNIQTRREYRDFLIVRFDQYYDFDEAQRATDLGRYPRRPFSDLRMDVTFNPGQYVSLENRTWFSPYMSKVTQHDHMLRLKYSGLGEAYFGFDFHAEVDDVWRKNQSKREMLRLGGLLHLPGGWAVHGDYRADLQTEEDLERTLGIGYTHQCYFVEFLFSQTPDEDRYEIRFSLKGLGDVVGLRFGRP
jgi:LPS-assembly protein